MCCVTYYLPVSVGKAVLAHLSANLYVDKVIYAHQSECSDWIFGLLLFPHDISYQMYHVYMMFVVQEEV